MRQPPDIDPRLVDFAALGAWMDREGLPGGPLEDAEMLAGGTQNVLVRFSRGGRTYVLRRPPPHPRPRSNDVLRREIAVLSALSSTHLPHPRLIAACSSESVLGVVFYLTAMVDGFNPTNVLPLPHAADAAMRHEMGLTAIDALALLGEVDYREVGLEGLGRPDGFIDRQVGRWLRELASYDDLDGYPGPDLPGLHAIADWLASYKPASWRPGIMHGDYHLGNLLYAWDGPAVAAVLDWEMCTIGDPLLDLGRVIAAWPTADEPMAAAGPIYAATGLPTARELAERYARGSARPLDALNWYVVLACFKLGIVLEGTYARAFAGQADERVGDRLHATTLALFERANTLINEPGAAAALL